MNEKEKNTITDLIDDSLSQVSKKRNHFGVTVPHTGNNVWEKLSEKEDKKIRFIVANSGVYEVNNFMEALKGHPLEEIFRKCIQLWKPYKPYKPRGEEKKISSRPQLIKLISIIDETLPKMNDRRGSIEIGKFIDSKENLLKLDGDSFLNSNHWKSISSIGSDFETSFRDALCYQLNENCNSSECESLRGLEWTIEKRFPSEKLPNKRDMSIDIFGEDTKSSEEKRISIELKYVTQSYNGNHDSSGNPSNFPGFHYDILKDCIKTEILLGEKKVDFGVVIGMTNYPSYWGETAYTGQGQVEQHPGDWARNSLKIIAKEEGALEPGVIETKPSDRGNLENSLYCEKRFHISLSREWSYKWADYSNHGKLFGIGNSNDEYSKDDYKQKFRYISFIPSGEIAGYKHELDDISCIPFLEVRTRERAEKRRVSLMMGKK